MDSSLLRKAAALSGAMSVGMGAFGAHALKAQLTSRGTLATWKTAVLYQLVHSVALLALSVAPRTVDFGNTGSLWIVGSALFSGSLYGLAMGGPRLLGPVTPIGGLIMIGGWVALGLSTDSTDRP